MKIVIDIPDEEYTTLSKMSEKEKVNELSYCEKVIANGTSLPKGHGDLIDEKNLLDKWNNLSVRGRTEFDQVIMCQPPVIPSDEGE